MFKVASYLNFKVPDAWDILVAKLLDSKAKIKKKKDFVLTGSLRSLDQYHQFHYCCLSMRYQAAII